MPLFLQFSMPMVLLFLPAGQTTDKREQEVPPFGALYSYGLHRAKVAEIRLAPKLREVSGLAMSPDGRLFAHNDEEGIIFQLDPLKGYVLKRFSLGSPPLRRDFEGLAIADSTFYLATSDGDLFEFAEGFHDSTVDYSVYKTGLSGKQNVEGVCYHPPTRSLLLACKGDPGKGLKDVRAIYRFSLESKTLDTDPVFLINLWELRKKYGQREFRPTGIEYHPTANSFFLLSSEGPAMIEISRSGELIGYVKLPRSLHPQPEGLTFGPDLTLYIANEGKSRGTLLRYPFLTRE